MKDKNKYLVEFVQSMIRDDLSSARQSLKSAVFESVKTKIEDFKKEND